MRLLYAVSSGKTTHRQISHDLVIKFTSKMGDLSSHLDFQYFQAPFSSWDDSLSGAKAVADFLRENTKRQGLDMLEDLGSTLGPLPPTYAGSRFQRQHLGNGAFLLRPPAGLVCCPAYSIWISQTRSSMVCLSWVVGILSEEYAARDWMELIPGASCIERSLLVSPF